MRWCINTNREVHPALENRTKSQMDGISYSRRWRIHHTLLRRHRLGIKCQCKTKGIRVNIFRTWDVFCLIMMGTRWAFAVIEGVGSWDLEEAAWNMRGEKSWERKGSDFAKWKMREGNIWSELLEYYQRRFPQAPLINFSSNAMVYVELCHAHGCSSAKNLMYTLFNIAQVSLRMLALSWKPSCGYWN